MISSSVILKNGLSFPGKSPQGQPWVSGEIVFTTGMTGYVETLTDPSFIGQILCFTYPLLGNYGVPASKFWESSQIHAAGVILSSSAEHYDHPLAQSSFLEWLKSQKIPYILDVDTRRLTKVLREKGVMVGGIGKHKGPFCDPNKTHLVSLVSIPKPKLYGKGKKRVIAVDCGMKKAQLDLLCASHVEVLRVPYDYNYLEDPYDALFLSNGPGDPEKCVETLLILKEALKQDKPIFGICLGVQLLALASGASTYKLPYGHRGQNQPCLEIETQKCFLTSQNHGYAIDAKSLKRNWRVSFKNLNDGSVEGIAHKTKPFFGVQFHPEAKAGPLDTEFLFQQFCALL